MGRIVWKVCVWPGCCLWGLEGEKLCENSLDDNSGILGIVFKYYLLK